MTKRLEDYLNEGAFAAAEEERASLGKQISFAEFLYANLLSDSNIEKMVFRYQNSRYNIDKEKFANTAKIFLFITDSNYA